MPNAFAFLMGKQSEDMPASPINNETIKADVGFDFSSRCHVPLDNETSSIVHQFRELGYKTMWAEDWAISTYNWPTCIGYSKPPADHNFKPFTLRTDFWSENSAFGWPHKNAEYYFTSYQQDHCREYYQVLLDYLEQFLRFYDDVEQKLSLTWIVDLNHHNLNSFYRADALLYSTFRKLKRKLENSFLFVMSDHGIRFGPHRNTEVGALEDNNPALFIALPKALRRNVKLNEIMNENARHLISHHDLYATLLSIAKLENSFLFVMSDHGIRFGPHRNTEVGALEDNNPALFIALPKALRRNVKLNEIMNENARHLISHHDLYATLLSIAKLENSFLFVMSDHGIRFGPHRNTEVGALEDNNPALFIALPKALRRNVKLNEIMNENARHLISHHDLYATLLSIAKNGHEWNDSDWDSEWPKPDQLTKLPNMHGSSLFHYPMKQPRDCATLRIPFDYCQCPGKYIKVTKEDDLKVRLALKSLEKLNGDIKSRGFSDKCEELQLDKDATIKLMELVDANYLMKTADDSARTSVRHFKIVFQATPGGGLFSIKIRKLQEEKVEFTADQFERLNKHGDQSKCAQQDAIVMQLCFCKS
ncbi:sulfatase domain-containing protein [Ditylenchus destructor]|uniref:Sulfatase domain-containing protein n=1 Tax=Ditylenchus destructor TaxID=166010 RepID=A0AAD4R396_9BILA|nr:sulfatase domain-containing protein [Ditylenchus destructor]